ncbi:hypothetical protein [Thermoflavimicrobium daqui]|uniref:Uncharacterized protein n=1 Tax=Thermoflavimicrobium daqui TaxID=2137476 RepID=A0A364K9E1_9BACL|nr:hypothetical protein [Thermoflavimicrobium daqui]RAL26904.1 hypothetical protein DL897_02320 [Thermoflavimicrobium daqui]
MEAKLKNIIEDWLVERCKKKDGSCNISRVWEVASELVVDPLDVMGLFEHICNHGYLPVSYHLQFYSVPKENSSELEYMMVVREEGISICKYPFAQFTSDQGCWESKGVFKFIEQLIKIRDSSSGMSQLPPLDEGEIIFNQAVSPKADPHVVPFQQINDVLYIEGSQSAKNTKENIKGVQKMQKLLAEVARKLDGTIGSVEKGIEQSALIIVNQGDSKSLMKLLLSIEEELKEIQENISEHLNTNG